MKKQLVLFGNKSNALAVQRSALSIDRADPTDLLIKLGRIGGAGIEPVTAQVWFDLGIL